MTAASHAQVLETAFQQCRDMDASLGERLETFAGEVRRLRPGFAEAVDRMIERLKASDAGKAAPQPGDPMPPFVLPDDRGRLVSLKRLLAQGPVAVTFHRGHWCPYCRISINALAQAQRRLEPGDGQIVAIMPDRQQFAAEFRSEAEAPFPVLCDPDNGYAMSLNLAIWIGAEMQQAMSSAGRDLPSYQGNEAWMLPIPGTFIVGTDGLVKARFVDPDYRRRMAIEEMLSALRRAR